MEQSVYMVTEFYTPYKHNGCTEDNQIHLFRELHHAVEYVRGTDGNGNLLDYKRRVGNMLKDGHIPSYTIGNHWNGITFIVNEECLPENLLKHGGYVYKVTIERIDIQ